MKRIDFDIIVVGAGHAGIEAALSSARLGMSTLVVTTRLDRIGYMSCNPAIGGLAKGHMVREIDALGGEMGLATDATTIQFKRLNSNRGPAVRGSRSQCDKDLYSAYMIEKLKTQPGIQLKEDEVKALAIEGEACHGVVLSDGSKILSKAVIITTGTFMNGVMHIGSLQIAGGRVGDKPSVGLSDQLRERGFVVQRLKTGTPARLHKDSIDWSQLEPQYGDEKFYSWSFRDDGRLRLPQVACYMTYTNHETHDIIRKNLHLSPMYAGIIEGIGPRYCPSIEDKICRFAERNRHQTFLEPEGLNTDLIYLQGISTSLPEEVQDQFLRTIPGLKNVKVVRYGYAVEYDFIEPTQIKSTLETRAVENLFLAGQINGTSGYEEAAAQGLVAGINASRKIKNQREFILGRNEAYIGVLVDDLVTKGTQEPYRMFTSRAEHRLVLREDNTIERLAHRGYEAGLLNQQDWDRAQAVIERRKTLKNRLESVKIVPNALNQKILRDLNSTELLKPASLADLLRRPDFIFETLKKFEPSLYEEDFVTEPVEIEVKYSGYVARQNQLVEQSVRLESMILPQEIRYKEIKGLSHEEIEKLERVRPSTIGQASRISGVNPSAIQSIFIYLKGHRLPISKTVGRNKNGLHNSELAT